jgi:integrase
VRPPRKVKRKHGYVWEVRYRAEGRHKSRIFDRKADAEDFQAEVRRRKRLGTLAQLHAGDELLGDFAVEWWSVHAKPNLARSTLHRYSEVWDRHVLPRLGAYRLKELTPEVVANLRADLTEAGVGDATIRKALFLLQGVLGLAVVQGAIATNPVKAVRKPRQASRSIRPLAPETVEAIRRKLRLRDATLVSVLAYAGLRPGEALALRWENVRERTLLIERSISLGREKATKTNATRTARLLAPLALDLAEWRLACGRPDGRTLLFPRPDGQPWSHDDYRNWRVRIFRPAAAAAGVDRPRPYDLRHSFVSLLIQEGVSVVEVARQAGHSPEECLRTYAHTFEEFDPAERTSAEAAIGAARSIEANRDVRVSYARASELHPAQLRFGFTEPSRRPDSNRRHPLYERGALPTELRRRAGRV